MAKAEESPVGIYVNRGGTRVPIHSREQLRTAELARLNDFYEIEVGIDFNEVMPPPHLEKVTARTDQPNRRS